jgi:hypothetical protein
MITHLFIFTTQVGSLVIHNVNKRDSGNYSCSPSNSPPLQITLNVINGSYNNIFLIFFFVVVIFIMFYEDDENEEKLK